ncbi:LysR family transcriptional regulator [Rhodobacter sp. KR11]|uniref:LysR family transcriptional regulator n=1 Tax=Rhodobacter sp. KR11 TaxID=2974588 RepID=UPI002223AAE8|nr:LysR family transcriptional regulator [Rhodobacter sp. KR11]MCW1920270.1 LysR family transcriptional regulator [Rhodobacter sp. KR11]
MLPRRFLPSLPSLLALEALDRLGTASAAGVELNLTQSAVSHQLTTLEAQLGVVLLRRERGRLTLTPAAQDFVAEARAALHRIAQASLTLRANPTGGTLSLAILPAFGMRWLAPRLAGFAKAHPEVTVNLSTRLKPFDFATAPFDAAIHYGREDWQGAAYLKLMDEEILAAASPAFTAQTPDEVLTLPLLQLESRAGDWHRWFAHHGRPGLRPPAMLFDQFATMQQAAVHGLGAALLPLFLIEDDLAAGRLQPLCGPAIPAAGSYYLVWPKDRPQRAPLASFIAWLRDKP